jgi:hypothetical protein
LAQVFGAGVLIVAGESITPHAAAPRADVYGGTHVQIVTRKAVGVVFTTATDGTGVRGARIVVVAGVRALGCADASRAVIPVGAGVSIVARAVEAHVHAQTIDPAGVFRTRVLVITVHGGARGTDTFLTRLSDGARISV